MLADQLCLFCGDAGGCGTCGDRFDGDNVVDLDTGRPIAGVPEHLESDRLEAISLLEDMIERLRCGVNVGFAIVLGVPVPGAPDHISGVSTVCSPDAEANAIAFMGGCDRLKHRLNMAMDADEEDYLEL